MVDSEIKGNPGLSLKPEENSVSGQGESGFTELVAEGDDQKSNVLCLYQPLQLPCSRVILPSAVSLG